MDMLKKTFLRYTLLFLLICPGQQVVHAEDHEATTVFTSLAPVAFVVGEIGGDLVDVHALIPQGRDPHTFSPTPRQVVALSQAAIYFTVAMTFEKELLRRLNTGDSRLAIVDCSAGISKLQMGHDHHQHHAETGDPHIWLGTRPLAQMARNIYTALALNAPQHQQQFQENLNSFLARLNKLHTELAGTLAPFKGRSFLVFHPSFGYFAESFGLVQEAVEIEGKSPSPQQLTALIKLARAKDITVIFVQPQFDKRAAERMAQAINAKVLPLDPLAANVFDNLQAMTEKIATSLGK
jgi:zinc transport system substrate-binding protein